MASEDRKCEIISRKDAKRIGKPHYFTGRPCKHGHVALRATRNLTCCECLRLKAAKYRIDNPEKVKETDRISGKKYRLKNREAVRASTAAWQKANPDRVRAACARYSKKNRAKLSAAAKEKYWENPEELREKSRRFYRENKDLLKQRAKEWRLKNPDKIRASGANRRALKRRAGGRHTAEDVKVILKAQRGRCAYCRMKLTGYHVDHIIPLTKGGTNDRRNLQIVCQPCNQSKYSHDPLYFARKLGKLL